MLRTIQGLLRHLILRQRRRHTLYSGQYLKYGLSDLIQIWHVHVTSPEGVLYSLLTLNSTPKILILSLCFLLF